MPSVYIVNRKKAIKDTVYSSTAFSIIHRVVTQTKPVKVLSTNAKNKPSLCVNARVSKK